MRWDRPARILVIDDQEQNIRLLARILEKDGYEDVRCTSNAAEAIGIYKDFDPDLVLLDFHMREKDGLEVLQEIVALNGGRHAPVVMVTADDSLEVKHRALALGAKDFIRKPFDSAEVLLRIANLLETELLHQRLREQ